MLFCSSTKSVKTWLHLFLDPLGSFVLPWSFCACFSQDLPWQHHPGTIFNVVSLAGRFFLHKHAETYNFSFLGWVLPPLPQRLSTNMGETSFFVFRLYQWADISWSFLSWHSSLLKVMTYAVSFPASCLGLAKSVEAVLVCVSIWALTYRSLMITSPMAVWCCIFNNISWA